ncbi:MAG TPA: deoxyribose-phosphate aldolase [Terriglobales bacterium]|jgi:deoxyribose-phosphate aldolase|nr:deoxyribose-phosphate aldolase [Terriglobales bacterium]
MSVYSPVAAELPVLPGSDWRSAAKLIEHTQLKPDATRKQLMAICHEAVHYGFHAVMVNPVNVALAAAEVRGSGVKVGTVIGFPLGASLTVTKMFEAEMALRQGADELDMVMNIGALKSGDRVAVQSEVRSLVRLVHRQGAILKLILENALLSQEEKILACALAAEAGVDFVKTSSGLADSGATVSDIALMRGVVGFKMGVKAAGGIRTAAHMMEMVEAGASRIGTSASVQIIQELGAPADN